LFRPGKCGLGLDDVGKRDRVGWSDVIEIAVLALFGLGGAWLGIRVARWSRTDDGRDWLRALSELRGEEYVEHSEYPINGAELARRLLTADETRDVMVTPDEYKLVQYRVRNMLRQFGCPKQTASPRSDWVVDEDMAARVADELGFPLTG
jgi:hypothetical protein